MFPPHMLVHRGEQHRLTQARAKPPQHRRRVQRWRVRVQRGGEHTRTHVQINPFEVVESLVDVGSDVG